MIEEPQQQPGASAPDLVLLFGRLVKGEVDLAFAEIRRNALLMMLGVVMILIALAITMVALSLLIEALVLADGRRVSLSRDWRSAELDGPEVVSVPTAALLLRDARGPRRGQKLLYWHTLSSASLEPFLVDAPEAPERFVRLMTLA